MRLDGPDSGRMTDPAHPSGEQLARGLQQWGYRGSGRRRLAARLGELAELVVERATPEHLPDTQFNNREHQHIGLLGREIRRRATALTATARAVRKVRGQKLTAGISIAGITRSVVGHSNGRDT